jgi:hypothetical protein
VTVTLERTVEIEAVRTVKIRASHGSLRPLADSLSFLGLRRPVVLWKDGTLISGGRRHRAHLLLGAPTILAVFVDTIEDAAKCLLGDNEDDRQSLPMKPSEVCRLWELLRRLDAPAAAVRADEARRRGVELRRQTFDGKRQPGRTANPPADHVMSVAGPPFGMSATTAKRLWTIYTHAAGLAALSTDEKREGAAQALENLDNGVGSIWDNYQRLISGRPVATAVNRRPAEPEPSAPAARQTAAWSKSLPQMEGLVAGLVELGPPNADLTWDQVGPVRTRLMAVRRDLEKIIKKMQETSQS